MHVYYFFIIVGLILTIILLLQWMIHLNDKMHPSWERRRTTWQPELFDQDMEVEK